jgi:hypothetical protein
MPSARLRASAFSRISGIIPKTTTTRFSGLNTEPVSSLPSAPDLPCGFCLRVQLLACWLNFS